MRLFKIDGGVEVMAEITKEQVERTADLIRLTISEEETELLTSQLNEFMKYADQLNELDTENVKPTTHGNDVKDVMRKDEPTKWITQEEALKNAPDQDSGQVRVPSILE